MSSTPPHAPLRPSDPARDSTPPRAGAPPRDGVPGRQAATGVPLPPHQFTPSNQAQSSRYAMLLLSALMVLMGIVLAFWTLNSLGGVAGRSRVSAAAALPGAAGLAGAQQQHFSDQPGAATILNTVQPMASAAPAVALPVGLNVGLAQEAPSLLRAELAQIVLPGNLAVGLVDDGATEAPISLDWNAAGGSALYTVTFAAAVRFDTVFPETTWETIQQAWAGDGSRYASITVLTNTLPALEQLLGAAGPTVAGSATITDVVAAAWSSDESVLALVPFDQLVPSLAVLSIDGQNPVENALKFDPAAYPLRATLYAHTSNPSRSERALIQAMLAALPNNNRDPAKLTTLTMTGVTAMTRFMAREMDSRGAAWPAEVVGAELSSADITHMSNEVPFTEECETDLRLDNYNFCTRHEYFETLRLSGVDIIGLTGNHQNDFGRKAALYSLDLYAREGLPVYGGGRNVEEANRPLYIRHNGNTIAFLGANSYGPQMAWAEADYPGSARFDLNILSATIRAIKQKHLADLVVVDLQYRESYDTSPLIDQRDDFNALVRAGADIVTGVQSHVPQGMEFTDGRLILYGLGNLFFDQMESLPTRENMIAKHTLYDGRHLSSQIQTTLLYDYGQPRWMTPEQREALLDRVFANSYWEY